MYMYMYICTKTIIHISIDNTNIHWENVCEGFLCILHVMYLACHQDGRGALWNSRLNGIDCGDGWRRQRYDHVSAVGSNHETKVAAKECGCCRRETLSWIV